MHLVHIARDFILLLSVICLSSPSGFNEAAQVEIDPTGEQHEAPANTALRLVKATFINQLNNTTANLYWAGSSSSSAENAAATSTTGLKLFYGPLEPKGGSRVIEGYENQIFVLTKAGTYNRLGEFVTTSSGAKSTSQTFILSEDNVKESRESFPPKLSESEEREDTSQRCRGLGNPSTSGSSFLDRCQACATVDGCGYSLVRAQYYGTENGCFASHASATVNDSAECQKLNDIEEADTKTVDAWLNAATSLVLGEEGGGRSQRIAFRHLERAVERAEQMVIEDTSSKMAILAAKKANAALLELSTKLDVVFDDLDALDLLAKSRHPLLAAIHPEMPMVPRRTTREAVEYIARGEPVIITDTFESTSNPILDKWTLDYLSRKVFGPLNGDEDPKFNVAADAATRCCRYFEPQGRAQRAGYPYPFAPTTHLYRDTFDGFVKTVRKASRNAYNVANSTKSPSPKRTLHYLHEIVMNGNGEAVVAGGGAPKALVEDLDLVTAQLQPLADLQPFFGGFANAKIWLGQKGIVMPIHYDATDNLYIMAWGRKRAIVGEPGQLDSLYRYPNGHPLTGSSQVNLTDPDLELYPHFREAQLREVIVGPGDVLYLPAWWWHQFEQPFEDTAALNLWAKDRENAPDASMRDMRVREHLLADQLEHAVTHLLASGAGVVLEALANEESTVESVDDVQKKKANTALLHAAKSWQTGAAELPGGHPKTSEPPEKLVQEHLERTYRNVMDDPDWTPGAKWNLSKIAKLPRELRDRCETAPESSPFMSLCS